MRAKSHRAAKWLVIAALAILDIVVLDFDTQTYQHSSDNQSAEKDPSLFGGPLILGGQLFFRILWEFVKAEHDPLLALFTILLAVFTLFLWLATRRLVIDAQQSSIKQARTMRRSVAISKLSARAASSTVRHMQTNAAMELRAYVLVKKISIARGPSLLSAKKEPHLLVSLINFGKIPARNLLLRYTIIPGQPMRMVRPFLDMDCNAGVIAPSDEFTMRVRLSEEMHISFSTNENTIHAVGDLSYHDGFSDGKLTSFWFKRIGPKWTIEGDFDINDRGNDYT